MSHSEWRSEIGPWLSLIIGLAAIFTAAAGTFYLFGYQDHRSEQIPKILYQNNIKNYFLYCISDSKSIEEARECADKDVIPIRSDEREEMDLSAQLEMAEWAKWMFVLGVISVMITSGGTVVVALNLIEARRTTAAAIRSADASEIATSSAMKIGEGQNRAWLSLEVVMERVPGISRTASGNEGIYFDVDVTVKNCGYSPATRVTFAAEMGIIGPGNYLDTALARYCAARKSYGEQDEDGESIFPNQEMIISSTAFLSMTDVEDAFEKCDPKFIHLKLMLYGCVNYICPFTAGIKQTGFSFIISNFVDGRLTVIIPDSENWTDKPFVITRPGLMSAD